MAKASCLEVVLALVACLFVGSSVAQDPVALEQCRSIHHMEVDPVGSAFYEKNCLLQCNLHGHIRSHNINEGKNCSNSDFNYICQNGQCIRNEHVGYLDIELTSGSFSSIASVYVIICVTNSSAPVDLTMGVCQSCSSQLVYNTATPVWNNVCPTLKNFLYSDQSRVSFQLYDYTNPYVDMRAGNATITVPEVLTMKANNKPIDLKVSGGHLQGSIKTVITWTSFY